MRRGRKILKKMKNLSKSLAILLLVVLSISCNRKDVYYPNVCDQTETGTKAECSLTIPLDWSEVESKLPLLTSAHLYVYDEEGNFIMTEVAAYGKDFVLDLPAGTTYNFFITDNLLTAEDTGKGLVLDHIEDFYKASFSSTGQQAEGLGYGQSPVKPFAFAKIENYVIPEGSKSETYTEAIKPSLGTVDVKVREMVGDYLSFSGSDLENGEMGELANMFTGTGENLTFTEEGLQEFLAYASSEMLGGVQGVSILINNMRSAVVPHKPEYNGAQSVIVGDGDYVATIGMDMEYFQVYYYESDDYYEIFIPIYIEFAFSTFGFINNLELLPGQSYLVSAYEGYNGIRTISTLLTTEGEEPNFMIEKDEFGHLTYIIYGRFLEPELS